MSILADRNEDPAADKTTTTTTTSTTSTTVTSATAADMRHTPSDTANATIAESIANNSTVYLEVQCFLEGVQVPHSSVSVSYGINSPASCTLQIPASSMIRDLPETTKVHVFFKDFLPVTSGAYEWRLLFDGELSSFSYSVDSDNAYMQLNAIHSAAYMHLMQLMSIDIAQFMSNTQINLIGEATLSVILGRCQVDTTVIKNILDAKYYKSMADIVYSLMRSILKGVSLSATGIYYNAKLGNVDGGWKILNRMHGISKTAENAPIAEYDTAFNPSSGTSNSAGTSGTVYINGSYVMSTNYAEYQDTGANTNADTNNAYGVYKSSDFQVSPDPYTDEYQGMNYTYMIQLNKITTAFLSSALGAATGWEKLPISSGFRSERYNASVVNSDGTTAVKNSRHTVGRAADINTTDWLPDLRAALVNAAKDVEGIYIERNDSLDYIHLGLGG